MKTRPSRSLRRETAGFTLTEILIGAAILGLATATFLLSTRHAMRMVEQSDRELLALREAQNLLVMGGRSWGSARRRLVKRDEDLPAGLALYKVEPGEGPGWFEESAGGAE